MRTFTAFAVAMSLFTVASAHATDIPAGSTNDANVAEITDHVEDSVLDYSYTMMTHAQWQWLCDNVGYPYC